MKVQDFAYNVSMKTMELLEHQQHYKIPEETRKEVTQQILKQINALLKQSS